jgi:hypothetical protein
MSVGFGITFIGLSTRTYIEQTPNRKRHLGGRCAVHQPDKTTWRNCQSSEDIRPQPIQASLGRRLLSRDTLSSLGKERQVDGGSGNGCSRGNAGYCPRATRLVQEHWPRLQPRQEIVWEVMKPSQPSSYHEKYMENCLLISNECM